MDSSECSQTCAQSLMQRSKPSRASFFSREWKRGNLMRLRFGAISSPSLGAHFLTEWTSYLAVIPASRSAQPVDASESKMSGTSGPTSQMAFAFCDPESASSKTSKDTSALGCEKSLKSWKDSVTERRGAYSARLKLAHRTSGKECSSWPTATTRDWKGTSPGYLFRGDGKCRIDQLPVAVDQAELGSWPTPTVQEAGKIGNQANHGQLGLSNHPALRGEVMREKYEKGKHGPAAPANHSSDGSHRELWPTPDATQANDGIPWEKFHAGMMERRERVKQAVAEGKTKQGSGRSPNLAASVQNPQWATPTAGKLNPRWVETLMGLPVGWVMPSCAYPVTIAPTSCACWGTEWCQPPLRRLL